MDSPVIPLPFLLPHPDYLIALLPRKFGMELSSGREKFSVLQPDLSSYPPWGPEVVPVGTGMRDSRIRISLSNQGGIVKSSQGEQNLNQKENL